MSLKKATEWPQTSRLSCEEENERQLIIWKPKLVFIHEHMLGGHCGLHGEDLIAGSINSRSSIICCKVQEEDML